MNVQRVVMCMNVYRVVVCMNVYRVVVCMNVYRVVVCMNVYRVVVCMNVYRVVVCMNVYRGVPTGIYATNNPEACKSVAENCEANIIVVENEEQLEKILQVSIVLSRVP